MPSLTRYLFLAGGLLILAGLAWWFLGDKLKWIGRLPGDIRIGNEHGGFYFPVVTCILLSVVLSVILYLVRKFL